ncbi:MAG: hypothetical protein CW338_09270 [Clostridiales bacterium]|nr:hypothetical protein [Clostridiales bacterium]
MMKIIALLLSLGMLLLCPLPVNAGEESQGPVPNGAEALPAEAGHPETEEIMGRIRITPGQAEAMEKYDITLDGELLTEAGCAFRDPEAHLTLVPLIPLLKALGHEAVPLDGGSPAALYSISIGSRALILDTQKGSLKDEQGVEWFEIPPGGTGPVAFAVIGDTFYISCTHSGLLWRLCRVSTPVYDSEKVLAVRNSRPGR